ncbi:hypothetical protein [Treponema endosymbiont of Eucomonympha sp.]|uniref:hypothetical protein n=1 Tax=Treponema endosymbiont of Eucomonympha sp. TaxID=1580831 RepID=UPI000A43CA68|nr:hypothetical protein [Treponema endosymbiont of Eucomonympha sp.]
MQSKPGTQAEGLRQFLEKTRHIKRAGERHRGFRLSAERSAASQPLAPMPCPASALRRAFGIMGEAKDEGDKSAGGSLPSRFCRKAKVYAP